MPRSRAQSLAALFTLALLACAAPHPAARPAPAPTVARPSPPPRPSCPPFTADGASATARQLVQQGHTGPVQTMALSTTGYVATGGADDTVRIWDLAHRALVQVIHDREHARTLAWDEAGAHLVMGGATKNRVVDLDGHDADTPKALPVQFILGPDGYRARGLAQDFQKNVYVLDDAARGRIELGVPGAGVWAQIDALQTSADGKTIAARVGSVPPQYVLVWSIDGSAAQAVPHPVGGCLGGYALAPRGDFVAAVVDAKWGAVGANPDVHLYVLPTSPPGATAKDVPLPGVVGGSAVAFSSDGALLAAALYDTLVVWDFPSLHERWRHKATLFDPLKGRIASGASLGQLAFAPDGRSLLVTTQDGAIDVYDRGNGRKQAHLGAHVRAPWDLRFVGEDALVAAADGHVTVWSPSRGDVVTQVPVDDLAAIAVGARGDVVTVRRSWCNGFRLLYDGWSGVSPPADLVHAQDFGTDCSAVTSAPLEAVWPAPPGMGKAGPSYDVTGVSGGRDLDLEHGLALTTITSEKGWNEAASIDLRTRKVVRWEKRDGLVWGGDLGPIEAGFVTEAVTFKGGQPGVGVWDARTGKLVVHVDFPSGDAEDYMRAWSIEPGGAAIAVTGGRKVAVFALPDGKKLYDGALPAAAGTVAFLDPPGALAVGGLDGSLTVLRDGKVVAQGDSPGGRIRRLAWPPSKAIVAGVSDDGAVRIWDAKTGTLRGSLLDFDDDESIAYTPGGAYGGTPEGAGRIAWVFDDPVEPFSFEQFSGAFRRPDLVARRLAGQSTDDVSATARRPPRLAFATPPAPRVSAPVARVRARFASPARVDFVRAFDEGRPVAERAVCAAEGDVDLDAALLPGTNRLTLEAYDDRGFASNPVVVDVVNDAPSAKKPDLFVLAVGVSRYPNLPDDLQLAYADKDAEAVAAAFRATSGGAYGAVHVDLLRNEEVTVASVRDALARFAAMAPDDVGVVFMAGHGMKPTPSEDMVFVTSAAAKTIDSVRANGVGWPAIRDRLAAAKGRVLVLLDACHSGHLTQDLVVPNDALAEELVAEHRAGVTVFAAAKGRQVSYEPDGARALVLDQRAPRPSTSTGGAHGYFTAGILASLGDAATDTDGDGAIELSELADAVEARVAEMSRGKQTPWIARREAMGDFRVVNAPGK